jgi:hypothetical protein
MEELRVRLPRRIVRRINAQARREKMSVAEVVRDSVTEGLDGQRRRDQRFKEATRRFVEERRQIREAAPRAIPSTINGETIH